MLKIDLVAWGFAIAHAGWAYGTPSDF